MSKILKPRRGVRATMYGAKANTVLAAGEIFFEVPDSGVGTDFGKIKMGDGVTNYANLPYFMTPFDIGTGEVSVINDGSTTSAAALNNVSSGKVTGALVGSLKQAITLTKSELTTTINGLDTTINDIVNNRVPFKLGISGTTYGYYKNGSTTLTAFKSQADIDSAVAAAKVGTATTAQVLTGYTFTNSTTSGLSGAMPNRGTINQSLNTTTTSYTIPAGYHSGSGKVTITTQTKSAAPKTSAQTISPDSGKVLSSVSISAIPTQTKSVTATTSAQTVTPDSGKFLTSVTVSPQVHSGTYTPTTRAANIDMGAQHNNRYVTTTSVPNTNNATYTFPANDTGGTKDLGITNTYRYVNASNVYSKGSSDGYTNGVNAVKNGGVQYANATSVGWVSGNTSYGHVHMPEQYYKKDGADWAPEIRLTKSQINEMSNASGINTENYNNGYSAGNTAGYNNGYSTGRSVGQGEGRQQIHNEGNGAVPNLVGCLRVINSLNFHASFRLVIRSGYVGQTIPAQIGESGSSGRPWEQNGGSMDTSYWENTLGYVRDDNGGPTHTYYGFPNCGALYGGEWADFCCYNVGTIRFFVLYIAINANY